MPRPKKPHRPLGLLPADHPAIARWQDKHPGIFSDDDLRTLAGFAQEPEFLPASKRALYDFQEPRLIEERARFTTLFARAPDDTLAVLTLIRRTLVKLRMSQAGCVRTFLAQHNAFFHDRRSIMVDDLRDDEIAFRLSKPGLRITANTVRVERGKLARLKGKERRP